MDDKVSLIVFSGDMDKVMASFIIATGAAAMGSQVNMFFTFWGISAIKKETIYAKKGIMERMLTFMLPKDINKLPLSKMNMGGMGSWMMKKLMKKKRVASLQELLEMAQDLEVNFIVCQMSMDVMGIDKSELIDGVNVGGVASFLGEAQESKISMFV